MYIPHFHIIFKLANFNESFLILALAKLYIFCVRVYTLTIFDSSLEICQNPSYYLFQVKLTVNTTRDCYFRNEKIFSLLTIIIFLCMNST